MRQKILPFIIGSLFLIAGVSSCSLETDGTGGMEGYWHLVKVDTLETGGSADLSQRLFFWSFQVHLMEGVDRNNEHTTILCRFEKDGNLLRLYDARIHNPGEGDPSITDLSLLSPFGLSDTEENFTIEQSSHSKMTLSNGILRLCFKKM